MKKNDCFNLERQKAQLTDALQEKNVEIKN